MIFPTTRLYTKHQKLRHPHPLIVCERKIVERNILDFQCGACFKSFDNDDGEIDYCTPICVCLECRVLLHQSCADLPQNITHHPLHPDCTLTFHISCVHKESRYLDTPKCDFCKQHCRLYFQCSDCSIIMDYRCALLTATNYKLPVGGGEEEEKAEGRGHPHPLIHCNIHVNHYGIINCSGCYKPLENSAYCCASCKMLLHKSCVDLPHQIQHPFHLHHPLTLSDSLDHLRGEHVFYCSACRVSHLGFSYRCDLCKFYLCASPILYPMIYMPQLHHHPLAYSDKISSSTRCSKCTSQTAFTSAAFRCPECKFEIHDHCLPLLPPTVKAKWHRHPLTLTYDPIKDDPKEDERADFYCDCCEKKRDLKDPTYYCAECHLISHVGCVTLEVMDYLQGKSTQVWELCNTKVIVIGSIYAAAGNEDGMEQGGDHQDITGEDSDHILIELNNEIASVSRALVKQEAKLEEYEKKRATTSSKLKQLKERRSRHVEYLKLSSRATRILVIS